MSKWVSTDDRLPKIGKDVLIRSEHGQVGVAHICILAEDVGLIVWSGDETGFEMCEITHWCKLPKMPKGKHHESHTD